MSADCLETTSLFGHVFKEGMQLAESESQRKDPDAVPINRPRNPYPQNNMTPGVRENHPIRPIRPRGISLQCARFPEAAPNRQIL